MTSLAARLFMVVFLAALAWPVAAQAAVIDATVGPGFSISMGAVPAAGTHVVRVVDQSPSHNFSLRAPDGSVVASTTVAQTGTFEFTVRFVQGTYSFLCDPHAGSMNGSVVVSPPPPPPPPPPPVNVDSPTLSGEALVGAVLACMTGTWTNDPSSYGYQWRRDGVILQGEVEPSYRVEPADAGSSITCRVTAVNAGGAASVDSAARQIPAPMVTVAPPEACSGSVVFRYLASRVVATWSPSPDAHSYEVSISRAGSPDYEVVADASADTVARVVVSAGAGYEVRVRARGAGDTFSGYCLASASVPATNVRFGTDGGGLLLGWVGDDDLLGGPANDKMHGFSGNDRLRGGAGDDYLNGGPGRDVLAGNDGNDVMVAGRGGDTLKGGAGDDVINVRDGASRDSVICGSGRDHVLADVGDRVAADCERVLRSGLGRALPGVVVARHHAGAHR